MTKILKTKILKTLKSKHNCCNGCKSKNKIQYNKTASEIKFKRQGKFRRNFSIVISPWLKESGCNTKTHGKPT